MADLQGDFDRSQFKDWVNDYSDDLYAYALRRLPNRTLAEDMVQTAFLAALKSVKNFKGDSSPKTWLMSILKNKIMDHYRSAYRKQEVVTDEDVSMFNSDGMWKEEWMPADWGDMNVLDNVDFRDVFYGCIEDLPEQWNAAIKIKYLESKITPEELGVSRANYWKMLERARRQLRKCLEVKWFTAN